MRCPWPIEIVLRGGVNKGHKQIVPCGKCGACLQARRNDWAIRLKEEQRVSLNSFFLTLTYQDSTLKVSDTGFPTLCKEDLQLYFKRLRKRIDSMSIEDFNLDMGTTYEDHEQVKKRFHNVRYYAVGEYGTKFQRPHYHVILFNVPQTVLVQMHDIWAQGSVHCGVVNMKSIMYCLSYHITRNPQASLVFDREPEKVYMSRRPGIGHTYVKDRSKWNKDNGFLYTMNDGFRMRLPRYWKEKIFNEEQRAELTEKLLEKIQIEQEKVYSELERKGYPQCDINSPATYLHSLSVREANRQYAKVVKGQIF